MMVRKLNPSEPRGFNSPQRWTALGATPRAVVVLQGGRPPHLPPPQRADRGLHLRGLARRELDRVGGLTPYGARRQEAQGERRTYSAGIPGTEGGIEISHQICFACDAERCEEPGALGRRHMRKTCEGVPAAKGRRKALREEGVAGTGRVSKPCA